MIRPDFSRFTRLSDTTKGGDSEVVWREFLIAAQSFINHCSYKVNEDELSEITKSLQNWTFKRLYTDYKERDASGNYVTKTVNKGEIYLADLGMNQELAYCHPVLILDNIGDRVLVIPTTTSLPKINAAFHPSSNPTGEKKYRHVFTSDGFELDSALMLDELRIISKGRLLECKGKLNEDITLTNSIFQEVTETAFSLIFKELHKASQDKDQQIAKLEDEIKKLRKEKEKETEKNI